MIERDAHRSLAARVLRIERAAWDDVLDQFHARIEPDGDEESRLLLLRELFGARFPDAKALHGERVSTRCPACGEVALRACYRREVAAAATPASSYTYAVCDRCGHAVLLGGTSDLEVYRSPAYYQAQGSDGVGYAAYEAERAYREGKGERLVRWAASQATGPPSSLLEVGSGFGFTRWSAERLGLRSMGVDVNPVAAAAAHRLYGMETATGTLAEALASNALGDAPYDLVLYDFVLEHLADPVDELRLVARVLAPGGTLVLRVPGMEALEIIPFGSFYRSFRSDHLHLFTRASLERMLREVGFVMRAYETTCGADLLREVLPDPVLRASYAAGQGPDIMLCAIRGTHANPPRHPA